METPPEVSFLLGEIRDILRELLILTKGWKEEADRREKDWLTEKQAKEGELAKYRAHADEEVAIYQRWDQVNAEYLKAIARNKRVGKVAGILVLIAGAAACIFLGIQALGLFK